MEVIVLEYLHTGSYFQEYSSELEQIQTHFKQTYYGHLHVADTYQKMLIPQSTPTVILPKSFYNNYLELIIEQFIETNPKKDITQPITSRVSEQINSNQLFMKNIIQLLQYFETINEQTVQRKPTVMMRTGILPGEITPLTSHSLFVNSVRGGKRRSTLKRHVGKQTRGRKYKHRKSSRKHRGYKNKTTRKHR